MTGAVLLPLVLMGKITHDEARQIAAALAGQRTPLDTEAFQVQIEGIIGRPLRFDTELCPFCGAAIKDWRPVFGSFAPEWWETMREKGIDPATGHRLSCPHKEISR